MVHDVDFYVNGGFTEDQMWTKIEKNLERRKELIGFIKDTEGYLKKMKDALAEVDKNDEILFKAKEIIQKREKS